MIEVRLPLAAFLEHAAALAALPVTAVTITDRQEPSFGNSGWCWLTGSSRARNDEIPHCITKHFQRRDRAYTRFPTRTAALDALAAAALAFCKAAAAHQPAAANS